MSRIVRMSVSQRKYFVERINNECNELINSIKHAKAADTIQISNTQFNNYLKTIKLDKKWKQFKKAKETANELEQEIYPVLEEIRECLGIQHYDSGVPSIYNGSDAKAYEKFMRYLCNKTLLNKTQLTPMAKQIEAIDTKRKEAIDYLYGINELNGVKDEVNKIMKGTGVSLLGQGTQEKGLNKVKKRLN